MSTVSREIAERIAAGEFDSDNPTAIVKYTNRWSYSSYGVIFSERFPEQYAPSPFVRNPQVWWTKEGGRTGVD